MSYRGPTLIKEPELRWPIVIVAAIITVAIVLLLSAVLYLAVTQP